MDMAKKKRIRQRLAADAKAILFIMALLPIGYLIGVMTTPKEVNTYKPVEAKVKRLDCVIERDEPELEKLEYLGEFKATYYCCEQRPHICGSGDGLTATGVPVAPGIVAVDPAVIPLGSTVVIDGAEYLAADTGGLIKGNRIDIAVPTHAEALDLGVRTVEVWAPENAP